MAWCGVATIIQILFLVARKGMGDVESDDERYSIKYKRLFLLFGFILLCLYVYVGV